MRVQFGDFTLDCDRRQLFRGEVPVDLRPKVMELLETLVEQRPNALSKKELVDRLWRSTVVEEGSLKTIVAELRAALNDRDPENPIIRTVQRYGYAFAAKVESGDRAPMSRWCVSYRSKLIVLREGTNVIGRDPQAAVFVDATTVSRHHAIVHIADDRASIEDLGSKNGTFVGGRKIDGLTALQDRDEVRIGPASLTLQIVSAKSTDTEAAR